MSDETKICSELLNDAKNRSDGYQACYEIARARNCIHCSQETEEQRSYCELTNSYPCASHSTDCPLHKEKHREGTSRDQD